MLKYDNQIGNITVGDHAISTIVGNAVTSAFGVAGMAFKNAADGFVSLLKWENIDKGVNVVCIDNEVTIDIHIVVTYGINILAISQSITHNVSYAVEIATGFKVKTINVYVDSIKM